MESHDTDILHGINQYFVFAQELRPYEPLIAFSCDWLGTNMAVQRLQTAKKSTHISKMAVAMLSKLIDQKIIQLGEDKAKLNPNNKSPEQLKIDQAEYVKNFVLAVFVKIFKTEKALVNEFESLASEKGE